MGGRVLSSFQVNWNYDEWTINSANTSSGEKDLLQNRCLCHHDSYLKFALVRALLRWEGCPDTNRCLYENQTRCHEYRMKSWADDLSLLCIFRRSEPGASVTCFPFGLLSMWFLLVFRMRRKIRFRKKGIIRSSCTFSGFLWSFLQGSCSVYQPCMTLDPNPPGVLECISKREGSR